MSAPEQQPPPPAPPQDPSGTAGLPAAFTQDPAAFLGQAAAQAGSRAVRSQLAGPVAKFMSSSTDIEATSRVGALYLQAAAKQLAGDTTVGDQDQEMVRTKEHYEILEAVGNAAARCQSNRTSIASSGILVTLANMMMEEPHVISHAGVEFLQCCILAEQYRYAARFLKGQEGQEIWPSPTSTISVKQVLRYFYLRGMIHLGNDDLELAHRCFWTCLCVPADVSSKIAVEAWKKLVLVQCLLFEPSSPDAAAAASTDFSMSLSKSKSSSSASNIRVPSCMPNCLSRILGTNNKDQHQASIISMMPSSRQAPLSLRHQPAKSSQPEQQQQSSSSGKQPKEDEKINPIDCYTEVFKAFHDRDRDKLEKLEREHMEVWTQDGTLGLLHQVHGALIKCQVLHLAQIYSVVPLSKLATALKVDGGEAQVTRILLQTNVPCEIDDTSMVTFLPKPHKPATLDEIPEWMNLLEMVQKLDVAIGTNPRYLSLMKKEASAAGGDDSAAASGPRGVDDL